MPLNWDTKKCAIPLPVDTRDQHWRDALIESTMALGLGAITTKNVEEWMWRAEFVKQLRLGSIDLRYPCKESHNGIEVVPLTAAVLRRWVGLSTNASTETRAKFRKECLERVERVVNSEVRRALNEGGA